MKNRYKLLVLIAVLGSNGYAAQPASLADDEVGLQLSYCPQTVTCNKFNDPASCVINPGSARYWGELKFNGYVLANTYQLDSVISTFHSPNVEPATCVYSVNGYKSYQLSISAKKESSLEIYYHKPTNWIFADSANSYQGVCTPTNHDVYSCPLKQQPALVFYNVNIVEGVVASINNNVITKVLTSQYGKVSYDTALSYCRGIRECRVNLESAQGVFYGDVTVDMYNNMKILKVSSITPLADVSQIGGYNAVEVGFKSRLMP